jgi:hypothetical protein
MRRRCILPSSFRKSRCSVEFAICNQGSTRNEGRNIRRSAYATYPGNVRLLSPPSFKADSNRRLNLDWPLPVSGKSETWREGRKLLDRSLRPGATISYRYMMEEKTHMFLAKLLTNPEDFRRHIELLVLCLIRSY